MCRIIFYKSSSNKTIRLKYTVNEDKDTLSLETFNIPKAHQNAKMFFSTTKLLEFLKNPQKQYDIMKLYRPASNEGFSSSSPENSGQRSVSYGHH